MKTKIIALIVAIIVVGGVLAALKRDKPSMGIEIKQTEGVIAEDGTYAAADEQTIGWNAKKRVGGGHNGTINIVSGSFDVKDNTLTKGSIEFSLETLQSLDLEDGKGKDGLEGHIKSADFFDVENYPTGTFVLTSPAAIVDGTATLTGDLTLKGKTAEVSFPAMVQAEGDMITITGNATFNRTKYGINFASASIPGAVKDIIIEDEVGVTIATTFKK